MSPPEVGVNLAPIEKGPIKATETKISLKTGVDKAFFLVYQTSLLNEELKPVKMAGNARDSASRTLAVWGICNPNIEEMKGMSGTYDQKTGKYSLQPEKGSLISGRFTVADLVEYLNAIAKYQGQIVKEDQVTSDTVRKMATELSSMMAQHTQVKIGDQVLSFEDYKKRPDATNNNSQAEFTLMYLPEIAPQVSIEVLAGLATQANDRLEATFQSVIERQLRGQKVEDPEAENAFVAIAVRQITEPTKFDSPLAALEKTAAKVNQLAAGKPTDPETKKVIDDAAIALRQQAQEAGLALPDDATLGQIANEIAVGCIAEACQTGIDPLGAEEIQALRQLGITNEVVDLAFAMSQGNQGRAELSRTHDKIQANIFQHPEMNAQAKTHATRALTKLFRGNALDNMRVMLYGPAEQQHKLWEDYVKKFEPGKLERFGRSFLSVLEKPVSKEWRGSALLMLSMLVPDLLAKAMSADERQAA